MKWDLEERTEDAMVAYLKAQIGQDYLVLAAWGFDEPKYPCVIVHAGGSRPVSEEAEWHDARYIDVDVAISSEAVPKKSAAGNTIESLRARNARIRSRVINVLARSNLLTLLQEQGAAVRDVAFSMAQMTTIARSTEDRRLITTVRVEVLAEPVTGS